ncbi:MAG: hypothetical protein JRJ86_12005 [Deltaproteobacteria bacterium]|nr:hypothetical protein [Deltaproteobacteria bacterium]
MSDKQHIQASAQKDAKEPAIRVCTRLDELLGLIEWLKADQAKKGGLKNIQDLDELSMHMEKISRKMESVSREEMPQSEDGKMNESALNEILEYDRGIVDLLLSIEETVKGITGEKAVPESNDISNIQKMLGLMENRIKERESFLRDFGG